MLFTSTQYYLWTFFCVAVGISVKILYDSFTSNNKSINQGLSRIMQDTKRNQELITATQDDFNQFLRYRIFDVQKKEMFYPSEIQNFTFDILPNTLSNIQVHLKSGDTLSKDVIPSEGLKCFDMLGNEIYQGDIVKYHNDFLVAHTDGINKYLANETTRISLSEATFGAVVVGSVFDTNKEDDMDHSKKLMSISSDYNKMFVSKLYQAFLLYQQQKSSSSAK